MLKASAPKLDSNRTVKQFIIVDKDSAATVDLTLIEIRWDMW